MIGRRVLVELASGILEKRTIKAIIMYGVYIDICTPHAIRPLIFGDKQACTKDVSVQVVPLWVGDSPST